jgi:hypothetical protein
MGAPRRRAEGEKRDESSHVDSMRAWSASAINRYYTDPVIAFLRDGRPETDHEAGYYIVPHCEPDCCHAFGGVAKADLGPFNTRSKARRWSRKNLVMNPESGT